MILDFLTKLYNKGLGYSAINTARSALSSVIITDQATVGNHPLVKRFMKGVFNKRPALPRYNTTWDAGQVLSTVGKWSPASGLSLEKLTRKLLILMLLLSAQRGQTITLLDIRNMSPKVLMNTTGRVAFTLGDPLKTSTNRNHTGQLVFKSYPPDRTLCVVRYLAEYLKRTEGLREGTTSLFISYKKPHKAVGRDTISRWTKKTMEEAGINLDIFKPHSTRAASTSTAMSRDVPLETILRTAGWQKETTFTKFYSKTLCTEGTVGETLQDGARERKRQEGAREEEL